MIDHVIAWAMSNPLWCVGLLAAFSAVVAFVLTPGLHEAIQRGAPRC